MYLAKRHVLGHFLRFKKTRLYISIFLQPDYKYLVGRLAYVLVIFCTVLGPKRR